MPDEPRSSSSERRQELIRQRRILEEHLAWLDREILAAGDELPSSFVIKTDRPSLTTASLASRPDATAFIPPLPLEAEQIIAEYHQSPDNLKADVKRGCLLYFAAALALLGLAVGLIYFISARRRHQLRPLPPPATVENH